MHVLTNAEKLIPLRDAASLAESRRLAGMRMVTGTTSPSTRYERISVSPASCSIKSEYVIASHAFKPQYKCINYTPAWEQRKLGDVASSFDYGLNAAATEYDGQNKYLRITDIDDETHEFSKSDLTTPLADLAMSADYLLKEGDLLFARTGASVGKTYLYRQFDGMVYFAGFLIRARIGEGADPEFAYQATLTDAYKKYVAITSQRSGQPGVNAQEYADYQLMLPSKTEQQQIGMTLRSLDDSSPFISVSVYLFGKGAPCGHKHNQRRNVVLRLLLAMGRRLQGRRDSGSDNEEIQAHTGVAEKTYP